MSGCEQVQDFKLAELCYFKTGGRCEQVFFPKNLEELSFAMRCISESQKPYFLLGAGSNSLVLDQYWPGAVIAFQKMQEIKFERGLVYAGAGVDNSIFAKNCADLGLEGAAWMYRLPGQIGATVRMNARCYGGEISKIVEKVEVVSNTGQKKEILGGPSLFRGYKDTSLMTTGDIVGGAWFKLPIARSKETVFEDMFSCEKDRIQKKQFDYPTCGCVFKNDYSLGVPSGMLLEKAGAKKLVYPRMRVSPYHANFVYNLGASSSEILNLTFEMRRLVYEKFGVCLKYEMEVLGQLTDIESNAFLKTLKDHRKKEDLDILRTEFSKTSRLEVRS